MAAPMRRGAPVINATLGLWDNGGMVFCLSNSDFEFTIPA